jgi:eukaryotic-like serine/threonine-protein kinase
MSKVEVDRNLLFGLLAIQTGLVGHGALFAAFNAWTRDKTRSLAEILLEQGELDAGRRSILDGLLDVHLQVHDGAAGARASPCQSRNSWNASPG